jgi:anti-sigma B factor antagonist
MEITQTTQDQIAIFQIEGRLDSNTSPEFEEAVFNSIQDGSKKMVIDFQALEYISSAGLRVILKATKNLKSAEGKLILCAMQDYVREVFEISGFDTLLPITSTLDEAMNAF